MSLPIWLVVGYLAGSLPTSFLAGKLAGIDLREQGSKNLGATNVYRVLGWKYAIPVGLIDIAKGAIPVALASSGAAARTWLPLAVGCAAIVGHVFSLFLRFRGGKGVATAAGVVLALAPAALGISAAVWVAVLTATGFVSLASILGAVVFPVSVRMLYPTSVYVFWAGVGLAAFIVFTHRTNIGRLFAGTENRFGRRRKVSGGERT
jgi:glycerol-3-phosphate acyltransferase PlsY